MIKVRKENVRFKGSIPELCSELVMLLKHLRNAIAGETTDEIAKGMIIKAVKLGLKTNEEIEKDLENNKENNKENEV